MQYPTIHTAGKFVLKKPFVAKEDVRYSVTAIREFSDLYIRGIDVYSRFYESVGLVDGTMVNGQMFDFTIEAKLRPAIVTLEGNDDTVIYVPSTYIESYPVQGDVTYSRLVLSADLGAIPDDVPLDSVLQDIQDIIQATFGVKAQVNISRGYTDTQPTMDEHFILEQSRIGSIATTENNYTSVKVWKKQCEQLDAQVKTLVQILATNNLI